MFTKTTLATAAMLAAGVLFAQPSPEAKWVALDSSKPGTPADVALDRANSDANRTAVRIVIHGFYLEAKQGPDGTYQKITVPGLGFSSQTGAPELPVARFKIGIPTDAKAARFGGL